MPLWNFRNNRSCSVGAVIFALMLQPYSALAASSVQLPSAPVSTAAQNFTADVALKRGGVLQGQVVNAAGIGVADVAVELTQGRQKWQTKTDTRGWFQVADLRGGIYQFRAAGHAQVLRAWAAGTAPSHASLGVLVSPSTDVVRGQRVVSPNTNQFFRVTKQRLANPWVVGGVVATAVAIPVAIHNAEDDDPPATP